MSEQLKDNGNRGAEFQELANESENAQNKLNESMMNREKTHENRAEKLESARNEIEQKFAREKQGNKTHQPSQSAPARKTPIKKATKAQKKAVYKNTLKTIQKDMSPASRTFSKVIHNPVVEKASDAVGGTVARPVPMIAGSLSAIILMAIVYGVAKIYGYPLSGGEWIATFVIGWVLGMLIDWIRVAILGRKAGPA